MRRLLTTLFCLAALSSPVFAQTDDHNDAGPLIVGYAVVTATNGIIPFGFGGLIAFETFGYRSLVPALQAGVLPATLTTRIVLYASSNIRLSDNVGVAITNPGSNTAVVVGRAREKGTGKDGKFDRVYLFTDTWMERNGQWQCIASESMELPRR